MGVSRQYFCFSVDESAIVCYTFGMEPRIIAFDIGDRRIGVAVSDPFNEYAMPLDTYFRTGDFQGDVKAVLAIAQSHGVGLIVCGLPLNADGTESVQTEKTRRFVIALREISPIPVDVEDERYSTLQARGDLRAMGVSAKRDKKKKNVDSLAAAYILERYLEEIKRGETMKEETNNYEDDNLVELVDEEGNTLSFEHLLTFEYKGEWYVALTPAVTAEEAEEADEEEGDEVIIYRLVGGENDEQLETIEDDALLDEVFAEFCNQYEDFEDADEAAELDGADDDGEE